MTTTTTRCMRQLQKHRAINAQHRWLCFSELPSDTLAALQDFYSDRESHKDRIDNLRKGVDLYASQSQLSMDMFSEDWNASQFWVLVLNDNLVYVVLISSVQWWDSYVNSKATSARCYCFYEDMYCFSSKCFCSAQEYPCQSSEERRVGFNSLTGSRLQGEQTVLKSVYLSSIIDSTFSRNLFITIIDNLSLFQVSGPPIITLLTFSNWDELRHYERGIWSDSLWPSLSEPWMSDQR